MGKKYELLKDQAVVVGGVTLYRIRALRDIPRHNVKAGDLGGFIVDYKNLSQTGDAWVADCARVFGSAHVSGNVVVRDTAQVSGKARVMENALIGGTTLISGDAVVSGNVMADGRVYIGDRACCFGSVRIIGNAYIGGNAQVFGDAFIRGDAHIISQHDWVYISHVPGTRYRGCAVYELTAYRDMQGRIRLDSGILYGLLDSPEVSQRLENTVLADVLKLCLAKPVQAYHD